MKTVFLRVLEAEDKAAILLDAIRLQNAPKSRQRFDVETKRFSNVPNSPFAYWVSEKILRLFTMLPQVRSKERTAKVGLQTSDDFRFLRSWLEALEQSYGVRWYSFIKGGEFSRFYSDTSLAVGYSRGDQVGLKEIGRYGRGAEYYFRPGLTWPRRTTSSLSVRAMPSGCIFADKGPAVFVEGDSSGVLLALLALMNSRVFSMLVELQLAAADAAARSYEVGVIERTPVPIIRSRVEKKLARLAHRAWSLKRLLDTRNETSHAFSLPALLQSLGGTLAERSGAWAEQVRAVDGELAEIQDEIDDICFDLYGIEDEDRRTIVEGFGSSGGGDATGDTAPSVARAEDEDTSGLVHELASWAVGVAFGRFDVRLATDEREAPPEPEPFDPLPARSPGMVPEGEEAFRASTGVLVDDQGHADDLDAAVTGVLDHVAVPESCRETVEDSRYWLAKEFFPLHVKMYSKSRRKAPIYWQLATPSASYSVWLYYHRFTRDTMFQVLNAYVTPKVKHEEMRLTRLVQEAGQSPTRSQQQEIAAQQSFVEELRDFREEIARIAHLWSPDLDDGVIVNFAPLWRLVPQHSAWQKECKKCWDKLAVGDYDWSHLAMHLWPERVVPKCADDRSLAIAHGLEEVFWVRSSEKWERRDVPSERVAELVAERTSSAVKDALDDLLSAPPPPRGRTRRRSSRRSKTKKRYHPGRGRGVVS